MDSHGHRRCSLKYQCSGSHRNNVLMHMQNKRENAHLKHAVSKHEDELEANRKTIDSILLLWLHLWEEQYLLDEGLACHQHDQAVDTDTDT